MPSRKDGSTGRIARRSFPLKSHIHSGVETYLAYFDKIKELYKEQSGSELELYKDTEPECLKIIFESLYSSSNQGLTYLVEILHQLSWSQCLGNANHRTALLFLGHFLESAGEAFPPATGTDTARFERLINNWIHTSQALIRRRGEWGFSQARLEPEHREMTERWLKDLLGDQSDALEMIGPHRLMNFVSRTRRRDDEGD